MIDFKNLYEDTIKRLLAFRSKFNTGIQKNFDNEFPELKKEADKKMLLEIKQYVKEQAKQPTCLPVGTVSVADMIAWLEDKYNDLLSDDNKAFQDSNTCLSDENNCNGHKVLTQEGNELKKFRIGEWILCRNGSETVYQITAISSPGYKVKHLNGNTFYLTPEQLIECHARLWLNSDTKPGDVLVASDDSIFISNGTKSDGVLYFCALTRDGQIKVGDGTYSWESYGYCHPATFKQCSLLYKKLKENGYNWNPDTLELKKIRPNQTKTEWNWLDRVIDILDWAEEKGRLSYSDYLDYSLMLKSLAHKSMYKSTEE